MGTAISLLVTHIIQQRYCISVHLAPQSLNPPPSLFLSWVHDGAVWLTCKTKPPTGAVQPVGGRAVGPCPAHSKTWHPASSSGTSWTVIGWPQLPSLSPGLSCQYQSPPLEPPPSSHLEGREERRDRRRDHKRLLPKVRLQHQHYSTASKDKVRKQPPCPHLHW